MKFEKSRLEPIKIKVNGVLYPARINFNAMAELEEKLGMPFFEVINKFSGENFSARETQAVLYAMLIGGGVKVKMEDLDDADFPADIVSVMSDVLWAANAVVTEIEEQKEDNGEDSEKKSETA